MGLDLSTVASSALGPIGTNIKEQTVRQAKLGDEIFKALYGVQKQIGHGIHFYS